MLSVVTHRLSYKHKDSWSAKEAESIRLLIVQEQYPEKLIGKRAGEGIYTGQFDTDNTEKLRSDIQHILKRISPKIDLVVLSEHPGNAVSLDTFQDQADTSTQIIVVRLGYYD